MTDICDPYKAARDHLDMVILSLNLPANHAESLRTRHEADLRDNGSGGSRYESGAPDTAAWLRSVEASHPGLLGKDRPATKSAGNTPSVDMTNTTAIMRAMRDGSLNMSPEAAVAAHFAARAAITVSKPENIYQNVNMTQEMLRYKNDPVALAELQARIGWK